jgi:hypothetical protein
VTPKILEKLNLPKLQETAGTALLSRWGRGREEELDA